MVHSRSSIVDAAKDAAKRQNADFLSRSDFERISGISQHHVYRLFPDGGWSEVLSLAALSNHPNHNLPVGDDDLLAEFHHVTSELAKVPTWPQFSARASVSADVVRRRFGGLQGTLQRYRTWLEEQDPQSNILELLDTESRHELPRPPADTRVPSRQSPAHSERLSGIQYGPPLSFRGLRHTPINEQGVVYLFGMVSFELGYLVEAVHTAYPDCEAKRNIDAAGKRWQRVSIEFEFRSSNFRAHNHDPDLCDIIICWEHDWEDCPIEVLELRTVIDTLDG